MQPKHGRSVAVIGSGVAGLTAAYLLSARNRVTLYEADTRLGGHAHTHFLDSGDGQVTAVDSAFLVHNDRTYPTLCRLFAELGIATQESDMSMSVRADDLEYAGALGFKGLFACRQSLRPRHLLMLAEILRFHRAASRLLRDDARADDDLETLDAFLRRHRFSSYFVDYFIKPLVAAVWSCAGDDALRYPARYLFVFLDHHGMLSVFGSPTWRTVTGGSATYVQAIAARLDEVCTGTPVHSLRRVSDGVLVHAGHSAPRPFDAAVIAVHPDQALLLLDEPTAWERAVLGAIPYSHNRAQLHTDESVLPRRGRARASWNYLVTPGHEQVVVSYDISRLMRLNGTRRFLLTLGGHDWVDPSSVLAEMTYSHPLYTPDSVAAQRLLPTLDDDRVVFAGAYHGWGFHEDGAASGVRAARRLGADWPAVRSREADPDMLTPAIYRTTINHCRQVPVQHSFEYRSYSWYVDIDHLPTLPWWLRPFARFHACDHLSSPDGAADTSLRRRLEAFFAKHDTAMPDGRITALLQARVLGYVFNPLSVFWCHDRDGRLRHVIAEVHNTYGGRHAYLLPPADTPVLVNKQFYVSPFNPVDGHYLVLAPQPDHEVDVMVSLLRERRLAFTATLRGERLPATTRHLAALQFLSPVAPLAVAARIRVQGIKLWLRRVPVVAR